MQPFYLLDPREAVQDLFLLPDFVAARGAARTYDKIGTWPASQAHQDLDDHLKAIYGPSMDFPGKGPLYSLNNSAYDWGMDGVQLMVSKQFNTILAFIR
jgi:hypothetical protein